MGTAVKLYYTTSTILGDKWELIPSKLLVVDNLEDYLATKTYKNITDFQYIKNELELSINVDITQDYSQPRSTTNFKYVSIQNYGEQIHYYFVKKATWRSKTCVRFELVMDVLNTFQEDRDYTFKANTRIIREHKDRYSKRVQDRFIQFTCFTYVLTGSLSVDDSIIVYDSHDANILEGKLNSLTLDAEENFAYVQIKISASDTRTDAEIRSALLTYRNTNIKFAKDSSNYLVGFFRTLSQMTHTYKYWRKIDIVNEGLSPVLQCATATGTKIESPNSVLRKDWYLLYRNQNDPTEAQEQSLVNPVECYLIPSDDVPIYEGSMTDGRLTYGLLETGKYYYLPLYVEGSTTPDLDAEAYNQSITLSNGITLGGVASTDRFEYALVSKTSNNKIAVSYYRMRYNSGDDYFELYDQAYYEVSYIQLNNLPFYYGDSDSQEELHDIFETLLNTTNRKTWTNAEVNNYIDKIETLDRTNAKNIKLIKLPYIPYNFTITGGKINIPASEWQYANLDGDHYMKLTDLNLHLSYTFDITAYQPLGKLYVGDMNPSLTDSKGVAGDSKLYHSDFYQPTYVYDSFTYKVQLEKLDEALYNASNIANLSITFDMTRTINSRFMFTFNNLYFKLATENYAKYMPIARNNEEVLYNVAYLNYIRTGFNYDVKAKERANKSNMVGMGLSLVSTASALLLPSVPLKVAGVVAGLVSMAMAIKNTAVSQQQNEDNIQRKLQETANQTASVSGSDDVDLMSIYAGNRLKYLVYEPTPLMKSILLDLFFYAGYSSGRMGKPNHNTRVNFDYLECEASLENEGSIPDDCLQELINCFRTGVCYLHKTTRLADKWDFNQKYENWETSVMED